MEAFSFLICKNYLWSTLKSKTSIKLEKNNEIGNHS